VTTQHKSDDMDFAKLAELAEGSETTIGTGKETKKRSVGKEKMRMKTQTFRDRDPLLDDTVIGETTEMMQIPVDQWLKGVIMEIVSSIISEPATPKGELIADDSEKELLGQRALFIKVPLREGQKEARPKSLLTQLLGSVLGFCWMFPKNERKNRK
jgi:hypothetical protein